MEKPVARTTKPMYHPQTGRFQDLSNEDYLLHKQAIDLTDPIETAKLVAINSRHRPKRALVGAVYIALGAWVIGTVGLSFMGGAYMTLTGRGSQIASEDTDYSNGSSLGRKVGYWTGSALSGVGNAVAQPTDAMLVKFATGQTPQYQPVNQTQPSLADQINATTVDYQPE